MAIQNVLYYIFIVLALPRQSIAVSPSVTAWSGGNVTINCSCQVEPDKKPVMIWVKHHEAHGDVHNEKPEIIAHDDQILIDQDEEKFTAVVKVSRILEVQVENQSLVEISICFHQPNTKIPTTSHSGLSESVSLSRDCNQNTILNILSCSPSHVRHGKRSSPVTMINDMYEVRATQRWQGQLDDYIFLVEVNKSLVRI